MANKNNNKNNNTKGRNNYRNQKDKFCNNDKQGDELNKDKRYPNKSDLKGKTRGKNDASWYRVDSQVMKDAASLSFATTYGMPFDLEDVAGGLQGGVTAVDTMPGIMTFKVLPTFGPLQDWSSPYNVAIRDMYSFIRHANSGHSNYDAANLGMYLMAYDSAATYYAWMVRLYGLTRTVLVQNAYTPRDLVTASGGDYHDLVTNLADLRGYINSYAVRLNAMRVPAKWHVLERHMWLFTHVFADSPTNKASFYVFAPAAFWKYNLGADPAQSGLFPDAVAGIKFNLNMIKTHGEAILNSILNDEDFNIMSGDILKAYGDNTFSLNMISEDYAVMPVYDPEVLMQIHNASVITNSDVRGIDDWVQHLAIKEDRSETTNVGSLIFDLDFVSSRLDDDQYNKSLAFACMKHFLDVPTPTPDAATVCVATRLTINAKVKGMDSVVATDYGTEVIVGAYIMEAPNTATIGTNANVVNAWDLEKFDWHPYIFKGSVTLRDNVLESASMTGLLGDVDNYAIVSHATLSNIHRAAMLGMFEMV